PLPHPQHGAEEALSSSQDNLLTVPRPLRREVPRHPLQDPDAVHGLHPLRHGLGSSLPRTRRAVLTTLQASLHAADRPVAHPPEEGFVAPLRRRPLNRRREPRYRRPWRLCGPDSHRLAALSLSIGLHPQPPFLLRCPDLLDTRLDPPSRFRGQLANRPGTV